MPLGGAQEGPSRPKRAGSGQQDGQEGPKTNQKGHRGQPGGQRNRNLAEILGVDSLAVGEVMQAIEMALVNTVQQR